jgi:hypothetical protein
VRNNSCLYFSELLCLLLDTGIPDLGYLHKFWNEAVVTWGYKVDGSSQYSFPRLFFLASRNWIFSFSSSEYFPR